MKGILLYDEGMKKSFAAIAIIFIASLVCSVGFSVGLSACYSSGAASADETNSSSSTPAGESIWVTRPDGAHSCDPKSAESLEKAASELKHAGIHVVQSRKGNDGKMHAQMCGMPTGTTNAYLIPKKELPQAIALGFEKAKVSE